MTSQHFNSTGRPLSDQRQKNILLKISQSIIGTLDYEEVLQIISDGMAELLGIETGAIYLVKNEEFIYLGATTPPLEPGMPDSLRNARIADHPHIQRAINERKTQKIDDTQNAVLSPEERAVVELRNLRSNLYFPFIQKNTVLGVLILSTINKPRAFSPEEIELGQTVANQLSIGIQNAKLHAELDRNNRLLLKEIDERKIAEKALRESEINLSNALLIGKMGYWEFDPEENLFRFTDEFFKLFGTEAEKMGGYLMTPEEYSQKFVHPDDRHMVRKEIEKILSEKGNRDENYVEHKIIYANGTEGNIIVRYKLEVDHQGRKKITGANQDITERKRFEIQLREAKEKAEESDRLKSAFLANMSHEIRTPMNAILGFSNLLKDAHLAEKNRNEYIRHIESGGKQLLRIISDIIDISKIDANTLSISDETFNLNDFLSELYDQFKMNIQNHKIDLRLSTGLKNNSSTIQTDRGRLFQIFSNLLENAIKFTEKGFIEFGYFEENSQPVFFVKDTGIGIDPINHDIIFDRFRQIETSLFKNLAGTGLGLSIVKSIVELMQGRIWLESQPGEGTIFYFTLPIKKNIQEKIGKSDDCPGCEDVKNLKIIIAEDDVANFMYLEAIFKPLSCEIIHARDGKEAIELADQHEDVNIILMDLKMPNINGFEATKQIRQKNIKIPIIAQTAFAFSHDKKHAIDAGCTDFIPKPIDKEALLRMIFKYVTN